MGSSTPGGQGRSFLAAGMFLFATLGFIVVQLDRHRTSRSHGLTCFGAGVVQPVDALTRPLARSGDVFTSLRAQPERTPPVRPPESEADALHDTRRLAIWVGLVGGAAVVVASILRPLVSRRGG
jgi:hypothetical protein